MEVRAYPQAPDAFLSWKELPVPIELEAVCTPQLVWTLWRSEKFLVPPGNRTRDRPARSLVTTKPYLLHGAESFFRIQLVLQLVKKFPAFFEPEGSSPYSQVPATCPYPEPTPSSPHNPLPIPEDLS